VLRVPLLVRAAALLAVTLSASACFGPHRDWTDDLVWSPDGRRAVYLNGGDLYLTDTEGRLTPRLATDIYRVAWLGDSQRLLMARSRRVATFAEVASAIGPERTRALIAEAEHLWLHFQRPDLLDLLDGPMSSQAVFRYLFENHEQAMRERLGEGELEEFDEGIALHAVVLGRLRDGRLELGPVLDEFVVPIRTIRPADGDQLAAFVTEDDGFMVDDTIRTFVVPLNPPGSATLVASNTNRFPDWTPDGRTLLYLAASGADVNIGILGCLAKRDVVGADGAVQEMDSGVRCLVDAIFSKDHRVRSTADGRVLFAALEMGFPQSSSAGQRAERLFVFDTANRGASPAPLLEHEAGKAAFGFYELSPDRTQVLYGTAAGRLYRVDVNDGSAHELPLNLHNDAGYVRGDIPLAVWSGPDAITYTKQADARLEFIWRSDGSETTLSRTWPAGILPVPRK
jgi:hypothetical protein